MMVLLIVASLVIVFILYTRYILKSAQTPEKNNAVSESESSGSGIRGTFQDVMMIVTLLFGFCFIAASCHFALSQGFLFCGRALGKDVHLEFHECFDAIDVLIRIIRSDEEI